MKDQRNLLTILFTFIFINMYSQLEFSSGNIVLTNKDTIQGFIYNDTDKTLSKKIIFKQNRDTSIPKFLSVNDLNSFSINNGRYFESIKISYKGEKDSLRIFAKRLVKGKIDLFVFKNPYTKQKSFFLRNNKTKNSLILSSVKTVIEKNGTTFNHKSKKYLYHLKNIKEEDEISNVKFSKKSMSEDILKYNNKYKVEYPVNKYSDQIINNYSILIGTNLQNNDTRIYRISASRFVSNFDFSNNFSLLNSISYQYWKTNIEQPYLKDNELGRYFGYSSQSLNIMPLGVRYSTNFRKTISFYTYFAIGYQISKFSNIEVHRDDNTNLITERRSNNYNGDITFNYGIGINIKLGSNYIVTEVTPTKENIFLSLGYTF